VASDFRNLILEEIRRLADEDGGKPPGKRRFTTATGISEAKWSGRLWARWSDAVSDAGFPANVRQRKLDAAPLLDALASYALEIGRMPTTAEMKMRRRSDPAFPVHSTLSNHFLSREHLINALRTRAQESKNEILICLLAEPPPAPRNKQVRPTQDGLVYLLRSGAHYKIGRSNNIERRIREITVALPESTTLIHAIRTDDPAGIEAYWHRRFEAKRANGEWFSLEVEDVKAFCARKVQ
jgi:hypothetical protein